MPVCAQYLSMSWCIIYVGTDHHGRRVVVFVGKNFPANQIDPAKVSIYVYDSICLYQLYICKLSSHWCAIASNNVIDNMFMFPLHLLICMIYVKSIHVSSLSSLNYYCEASLFCFQLICYLISVLDSVVDRVGTFYPLCHILILSFVCFLCWAEYQIHVERTSLILITISIF